MQCKMDVPLYLLNKERVSYIQGAIHERFNPSVLRAPAFHGSFEGAYDKVYNIHEPIALYEESHKYVKLRPIQAINRKGKRYMKSHSFTWEQRPSLHTQAWIRFEWEYEESVELPDNGTQWLDVLRDLWGVP